MRAADRRYYTVAEASRLLKVSPSTIWRWIAAGRLRAHRLGPKTIRIEQDDLDALLMPASEPRKHIGLTLEEAKQLLAQPPAPEELARRQAIIERTLEHRKHRVIAPLTTADLVHMAREEEYESYGFDR